MPPKKEVDQVWDKGQTIRGKDPAVWRRDAEGNKIRHGSYGTEGKYGWEIDHIRPESKGGSDNLRNKQPLHWQENREKGAKIKK